jgi:hypothetical protein
MENFTYMRKVSSRQRRVNPMRKVTNKQVEMLFDNIIDDVCIRLKEPKKKKEPKVPKVKEHLDDEDKIKIALWFIKKMGGVKSAHRVFSVASVAIETMGDPK